jgi:hypothetical protein
MKERIACTVHEEVFDSLNSFKLIAKEWWNVQPRMDDTLHFCYFSFFFPHSFYVSFRCHWQFRIKKANFLFYFRYHYYNRRVLLRIYIKKALITDDTFKAIISRLLLEKSIPLQCNRTFLFWLYFVLLLSLFVRLFSHIIFIEHRCVRI